MIQLARAALLGLGLSVGLGLVVGAVLGSDAAASPPREGWPPDPPPVPAEKQWVFEVRVKDSVPSIVKVSEVTLKKPEPTPRVMGRYAIELYVGKELLDRVRFDVPLGGDGPPEPDQPGKKRPVFKVNTKLFARMADQPRAALVRLVDRATGDIQVFRWPPDKDGKLIANSPGSAADGGSSDAGADAGSADAGDAGSRDAGHNPDGI